MNQTITVFTLKLLLIIVALPLLYACSGEDYYEKSGPYTFALSNTKLPNAPFISEQTIDKVTKPIPLTLFHPKPHNGQPLLGENLIIILPASDLNRYFYLPLAWHLASHGHTVAAINLPFNLSLNGKHDWLAETVSNMIDQLILNEESPIELEINQITVIGHGLGGKIAFFAATQDNRIQRVAAIDPTNNGEAPCFVSQHWCRAYPVAPIPGTNHLGLLTQTQSESLIFRSDPDIFFTSEPEFNASVFFYGTDGIGSDAVPSPATYIDAGANLHLSWLPIFGSELNRVTFRTLAAWLDVELSQAELDSYLVGTIMQEEIQRGTVRLVEQR